MSPDEAFAAPNARPCRRGPASNEWAPGQYWVDLMASSRLPASERPATAVLAAGAASLGLLLTLGAAAPARAQVMEIASDGKVAVYDRPAVFTAGGAQTIAPARPVKVQAVKIHAARALTIRAQARALPNFTPAADPVRKLQVMQELTAAASAYSLRSDLVQAVAWRESRFRHDAVSPVGATGVMQLMPSTARSIGVDASDLRQNIYGGTAYLRRMMDTFGGNMTLGLAAYNAGPEAVRRYGGVPPYAETQNYVAAIMGRLADPAAAPPPLH